MQVGNSPSNQSRGVSPGHAICQRQVYSQLTLARAKTQMEVNKQGSGMAKVASGWKSKSKTERTGSGDSRGRHKEWISESVIHEKRGITCIDETGW